MIKLSQPNDPSAQPQRSSLASVGGATLVGAFIEWYDFFIYGIASALIFNKLFFPGFDPTVGILLSFAAFGSAWLVRPLGGLLFGYVGDRVGRKRALIITLVLMGTATIGVGLLPTYDQIGVWAPILLVAFRMVQGISAGGEWSGAAIMATEHAPLGRRGLYGAFPQMGTPLALIAANGVSLLAYMIPEESLMTWGWRIPFLLSVPIIPLGYYIRRRLLETPDFVESQQSESPEHNPLWQVVTAHWRAILVVFFANGALNAFFFTFTTYSLTYATSESGFTRQEALGALVVAALVHAPVALLFGWLSDRVGRRRLFLLGLSLMVLAPFPVFFLIDTGNGFLFFLSLAIGFGVVHGSLWGIASSYFTEMFPPAVRYSGSSIGFQFAGSIFGGPMPLIASTLVVAAGGAPWYLAAFVSGVCAVGLGVVFLAKNLSADQGMPEKAEERALGSTISS
ncbi:MFS transporter [Rhodococcus erythropolis]